MFFRASVIFGMVSITSGFVMTKLNPLRSGEFCLEASFNWKSAFDNVTPSNLNSGSTVLLALVTIARSRGCPPDGDDVADASADALAHRGTDPGLQVTTVG